METTRIILQLPTTGTKKNYPLSVYLSIGLSHPHNSLSLPLSLLHPRAPLSCPVPIFPFLSPFSSSLSQCQLVLSTRNGYRSPWHFLDVMMSQHYDVIMISLTFVFTSSWWAVLIRTIFLSSFFRLSSMQFLDSRTKVWSCEIINEVADNYMLNES